MKIFDAHFHIIDSNFPIVENNGYTPPAFTAYDYKKVIDKYNIVGGAIVSGSFQAFDQSYLINSLKELGNNFFGVANIQSSISNKEIETLSNNNVTAVRFNLKRGGSESIDQLEYLSNKLYNEYNWHTEFYLDSKDLISLEPHLKKIKTFSIDHLGLSKEGLPELYKWVEKGIKVKAIGFGRLDFDPIEAMKQIHSINPNALMFGTDLPSTRAKTPFSENDIIRIKESFNDLDQRKIFHDNAYEWYFKINKFQNKTCEE